MNTNGIYSLPDRETNEITATSETLNIRGMLQNYCLCSLNPLRRGGDDGKYNSSK